MSENATHLQKYLDELTQFASRDDRKVDLLSARTEYFKTVGEVFEDDRQFEIRMAAFLDWYLFDRRHPEFDWTPAQELYAQALMAGNSEKAIGFRGLTETTHSLFSVEKTGAQTVFLVDVWSGVDFKVTERRTLKGLEEGDVIEARLIPFGNELLFSQALSVHPKAAVPLISREASQRAAKGDDGKKAFVWECARMSLKVDRYRQIAVEKIYDFKNRLI